MNDRQPGDVGSQEWIAAKRIAEAELHPQSRAIESYERMRRAAVARGDRGEPIPTGTSFSITGRKMRDDEQ